MAISYQVYGLSHIYMAISYLVFGLSHIYMAIYISLASAVPLAWATHMSAVSLPKIVDHL